MKLKKEPYLLIQKNVFSYPEKIQNISVQKKYQNNIFEYEVFKKTFYLCLSTITLMSFIMISVGFVNEYSAHKNCLINSGIWDKQNSICGFLIIYGNNFELRKIVID